MQLEVGWTGSRVIFLDDVPYDQKLLAQKYRPKKGEELTLISTSWVSTLEHGRIWHSVLKQNQIERLYSFHEFNVGITGGDGGQYRWSVTANAEEISALNQVCEILANASVKLEGSGNLFGDLYEGLREEAIHQLDALGAKEGFDAADFCTIAALGLTPIAPLLVDIDVEEFYLDRPGALTYLDHSKYGRLWFPYPLSRQMLRRLGLYCQLSVSGSLNRSSNSLKAHLVTNAFHLRIGIDSEPLAFDGGSCVIRKFGFNRFDISGLIGSGTLTSDAASLLTGALRLGLSVVIAGLPRTGKTTLANALLKTIPNELRKLYVEDVVETSTPSNQERTVRLSTESSYNTDKLAEVTRSLHRSPDFVFVGELQSKQQTLAAIMLMNVGIPCLQTVHATTLEGLLARWREVYTMNVEFHIPVFFAFMKLISGKRLLERVVLCQNLGGKLDAKTIYESGNFTCELSSGNCSIANQAVRAGQEILRALQIDQAE